MQTVVTATDAKKFVDIKYECMLVEFADDMGGIGFGRMSGMNIPAEARH